MTMQNNGLFVRTIRSLAFAVGALVVAAALAGCGSSSFQPMYASPSFGGGKSNLSAVSITSIPGRVGQRIRNELSFQSTGGGNSHAQKQYRLDITIKGSVASTLVNAEGDAASQIYEADASFQLHDLTTGKQILAGTSFGRAGFERFEAIFANVRARRDAEDRVARTIAHDIKSRLEAFLARS